MSGVHGHNFSSIAGDWVFAGQMLNGAFITHKWRDPGTQLVLSNYSVPTLTIGGELDGNCRISRIIEQYYIQMVKQRENGHLFVDNETVRNMPVLIVEGMSHFQFADGHIPPNVLEKVFLSDFQHF